jgi:mannose-6-phosphate isomerase class I
MPASLDMVYKHKIKTGDVLLIKGGTVHAIGPGALIYEIMEPTDFVTQPEKYCGSQMLTDQDRFGTVDPVTALSVFNYTVQKREDAWSDTLISPQIICENADVKLTRLIDRKVYKYFGAFKVDLKKSWQVQFDNKTFFSGTVTSGKVEIVSKGNVLDVSTGESFFMPYEVPETIFKGQAEILLTLPPAEAK